MPSRSDWKNYTPGDIQGMSAFEKKDLFNNLERNYRALKNDRSAAAELPRIERILGFLGAKKDSAGNWSAPDFETAPTETGGDEVYKAARQMESDRKKKMEEEAAAERARPAETMSFDPLDVFGRSQAARDRENAPADPLVFDEALDIFGKMPASKEVEIAETMRFDPVDILGRKGFEGPRVEDMPGDENSGFSMSFPPLDILGRQGGFTPSGISDKELEKGLREQKKAEDAWKSVEVGEMNPSNDAFNKWLAFQLNPPQEQKRDEIVAKPSEMDFGDGLDLSDAEVQAESAPVGRPQDYENPSQFDLSEDLMGSVRQPILGTPSRPPLQNAEGDDASLSALIQEGERLKQMPNDPFRAWLRSQGIDGFSSSGPGARSEDLRNEMQALIMAKGGMPYSPQFGARSMAAQADRAQHNNELRQDQRDEALKKWIIGQQDKKTKAGVQANNKLRDSYEKMQNRLRAIEVQRSRSLYELSERHQKLMSSITNSSLFEKAQKEFSKDAAQVENRYSQMRNETRRELRELFPQVYPDQQNPWETDPDVPQDRETVPAPSGAEGTTPVPPAQGGGKTAPSTGAGTKAEVAAPTSKDPFVATLQKKEAQRQAAAQKKAEAEKKKLEQDKNVRTVPFGSGSFVIKEGTPDPIKNKALAEASQWNATIEGLKGLRGPLKVWTDKKKEEAKKKGVWDAVKNVTSETVFGSPEGDALASAMAQVSASLNAALGQGAMASDEYNRIAAASGVNLKDSTAWLNMVKAYATGDTAALDRMTQKLDSAIQTAESLSKNKLSAFGDFNAKSGSTGAPKKRKLVNGKFVEVE